MSGLVARSWSGYLSQQLTMAWARPVAAGKTQISR